MYLSNISVTNFKNIELAELSFSESLNCFVGSNGSGKTNILDAIHYLSLTKSALCTDSGAITHNRDFFIVQGRYNSTNTQSSESITVSFKRGGGKKILRGTKEYEKLSDHIGRFPLVMIAPGDAALISDAPEYRRRFLNAFLSQIDPHYLALMMRYNAVLASRNSALKNPNGQYEIIEILSEQLAEIGTKVYNLRLGYITQLAPVVSKFYEVISGSRESIEISYKSKLEEGPMLEQLKRNLERDLVLGYTSIGVHRDDISLTMNGYAVRSVGSQGQQKSLLLALKLSEARVISEKCGRKAILLLDDVFDKLDMSRVENLVGLVSSEDFGQIFITDSNKVRLEGIAKKFDTPLKMFEVEGGEIRD